MVIQVGSSFKEKDFLSARLSSNGCTLRSEENFRLRQMSNKAGKAPLGGQEITAA